MMGGLPLLSHVSLQLFRKAQIYLPCASLKTGIFEICRTGIESDYSCRSDMTCSPRRYSAVVSELYV